MTEDLKRQASTLYRELQESDRLPTSDHLSMKKLMYVAIGLLAAFLIVIAAVGGFTRREDAVLKASSPAPLVKEEPPLSLLEPDSAEPAGSQPVIPEPAAAPPPSPPAPQPPPRAAAPKAAAPPVAEPAPSPAAAGTGRPILKHESPARAGNRPAPSTAKAPAAEPKAAQAPPAQETSAVELARREMARDIVLAKSPAMANLFTASGKGGWKAEPERDDVYLVTFTIPGIPAGGPVQYVWRAVIATKAVTPLSYYARKLN